MGKVYGSITINFNILFWLTKIYILLDEDL